VTADLPPGAIFVPAGEGTCRMRALDNTAGQISDYGIVKCADASEKHLQTWMRTTSQDGYIEIGKSFRHEDDH